MAGTWHVFIVNGAVNLDGLHQLSERPPPFAPGESHFWDDPHISASMLAAHLDPGRDARARPVTVIERGGAWVGGALNLKPGDTLLALGCGPGLYAERFAQA